MLRLAQQKGVPASSTRIATKPLYLRLCKTTVFHEHYDTDRESRLNFVNWYLHVVHDGETDPILIHLATKLGFISGDAVNPQNNRYWSAENPTLIPEVLLHGFNIGMRCAMSVTRVIGPILFSKTTIYTDRLHTF